MTHERAFVQMTRRHIVDPVVQVDRFSERLAAVVTKPTHGLSVRLGNSHLDNSDTKQSVDDCGTER